MLLVWGLAWAYVRYGAQPQVTWLLYGIKPVIIAVVVQAVWGLLRTAVKGPLLARSVAARRAAVGAVPIAALLGSAAAVSAQAAVVASASLTTLFFVFLK